MIFTRKLAQLSSVNDQGKDTDASFAQRQDKDNQVRDKEMTGDIIMI